MKKYIIAFIICVIGTYAFFPRKKLTDGNSIVSEVPISTDERARPRVKPPSKFKEAKKAIGEANSTKEKLAQIFKEYKDISAKILWSFEEREFTEELYSNASILEAMKSPFSENWPQNQRMMSVLFLKDALKYKNNPEHQKVLSTFADLLQTDFVSAGKTSEERRSLAADQVELFGYLYEYEREFAEKLMADVQSERVKGLMKFAINFYFKSFERN